MSSAITTHPLRSEATGIPHHVQNEILKAVRDISFGSVEIVLHDHRVTEIRQTRRVRPDDKKTKNSADQTN